MSCRISEFSEMRKIKIERELAVLKNGRVPVIESRVFDRHSSNQIGLLEFA